jgi:hypothetical protein
MRTNRVAVLVAVLVFALTAAGLAVLVERGNDGELQRLPFVATGSGRDSAALSASEDKASGAGVAAMPYFGYVEYKASKPLAKPADTAGAYRLKGASKDDVAKLAKVFELKGPAKDQDGAWTVSDGTHMLRADQRSGQWFYGLGSDTPVSDQGISGEAVASAEARKVEANSGSGSSGSGSATSSGSAGSTASSETVTACSPCPPDVMCAQVCKPADPPEGMPSKADAERQARSIWEKAGIDPGKATVSVDDGWSQWTVHFPSQVGGTDVEGLQQNVGIGAHGVVEYASGWIGGTEKLGDYPLIDPAEALQRLNKQMDGNLGCTAVDSGAAESGDVPAVGRVDCLPMLRDRVIAVPEPSPLPPIAVPKPIEIPPEFCDALRSSEGPATVCSGSSGGGTITVEPPVPTPTPPITVPVPDPMPVPEKRVIEVTGVRLGLQMIDRYLVPVYVFSIGDGGVTPPVPAVPDRLLQLAAPSSR